MVVLWLWTTDWRIWIKKVVYIISLAFSFPNCTGCSGCPINQSTGRKFYEIQAIIVFVVKTISIVTRTTAISPRYVNGILLVINTGFVQILIVLTRGFQVNMLFNIWIWGSADRFLNSKSIYDLVLSFLAPWPWLRFVRGAHEPSHYRGPISLREKLCGVRSLSLGNVTNKIWRHNGLLLNFRNLSLLKRWWCLINCMNVDVDNRMGCC